MWRSERIAATFPLRGHEDTFTMEVRAIGSQYFFFGKDGDLFLHRLFCYILQFARGIFALDPLSSCMGELEGGVAQLVRAPACHAGGRRFESGHPRLSFLNVRCVQFFFNRSHRCLFLLLAEPLSRGRRVGLDEPLRKNLQAGNGKLRLSISKTGTMKPGWLLIVKSSPAAGSI